MRQATSIAGVREFEIAIQVVIVSRLFEPIADYEVDIGEQLRFLSQGSVIVGDLKMLFGNDCQQPQRIIHHV